MTFEMPYKTIMKFRLASLVAALAAIAAVAVLAGLACNPAGEPAKAPPAQEDVGDVPEQEDVGDVPEQDEGNGPLVLDDGTVATPTAVPVAPLPEVVPDGLEIIWEAYNVIVQDYVDQTKVDPAVLSEAAVRAMVDALEDLHSSYVSPETFKLEAQNFQGKFSGIGAQVGHSPDGSRLIIIAPLPDTPAEKAGIRAGDLIMAVNGEDAEGWSILEGVNKIRGPEGEPVTLTVRHVGDIYDTDITIVRGTIEQPSVTSRLLEDTQFGAIKMTFFTAETVNEMREEIDGLLDEGAKGVVLDLRQNPGGLLSSTVDIASEFLSDGLVTYELDGKGNRQDWRVKSGGRYKEIPLVVVVDEFSASGSEVLAGALQDHGRAVIIGTNSFGKGSVNLLRTLSNGGGIYLTNGHWYTPNGRLLETHGVTPDVVVEFPSNASSRDADFEDVQMSAAIKQLEFQTGLSGPG